MVLKPDNQPLMSEIDGKEEQLPVYRIDESREELQVGEERGCCFRRIAQRWKARCAERRARREANGGSCCRSSCAGRILKWIAAILLLMSIGHYFVMHHFIAKHKATCLPLASETTMINLPYESERTPIFLHPSITTGDTHIIHTESVANGSIAFTIEKSSIPEFTGEPEGDLFMCFVNKPRGVAMGIFARGHDAPVPIVRSTTVGLNKNVGSPRVNFLRGSRGCMKSKFARKIVDDAIARYNPGKDWLSEEEHLN